MALTTYSELKAAVADYLARSDLTAAIPDFITLVEAKLNRDLRHTRMEDRAYTTIDLDSDEPEFLSLPTDFQVMRRVRLTSVSGKPRLDFKSQSQLDEYRYGIGNTSGQPKFFTVFGNEMELCPTPDDDYEIEMVYRARIPALSDSNTTNWLLTLAPDAYLYGALMEAAPYLHNDERIPVWAGGFKYAVDSLNGQALDQSFNAGPAAMTVSGATP